MQKDIIGQELKLCDIVLYYIKCEETKNCLLTKVTSSGIEFEGIICTITGIGSQFPNKVGITKNLENDILYEDPNGFHKIVDQRSVLKINHLLK